MSEVVETPTKAAKQKRSKHKETRRFLQLAIPFAPHPAQQINHDLAANLAEDYGYNKKGQCYKNAVLSMTFLGYHDDEELQLEYVEGWLILAPDYAIEHGWLEIEGEVVDVTLPGEHHAGDYYGVYRYSFKQVQKLITDRRITLPIFGNSQAGCDAMLEAWQELPVNHDANRAIAILGYMRTGKWSVVIPEGVFLKEDEKRSAHEG